jgi:hypothetical protein
MTPMTLNELRLILNRRARTVALWFIAYPLISCAYQYFLKADAAEYLNIVVTTVSAEIGLVAWALAVNSFIKKAIEGKLK